MFLFSILILIVICYYVFGIIIIDKMMDVIVIIKFFIDSEFVLVLGFLKFVQELWREQQLVEIEVCRQEREKNGNEEGEERMIKFFVQEMVDEL